MLVSVLSRNHTWPSLCVSYCVFFVSSVEVSTISAVRLRCKCWRQVSCRVRALITGVNYIIPGYGINVCTILNENYELYRCDVTSEVGWLLMYGMCGVFGPGSCKGVRRGVLGFMRMSKILFGKMVWSSFRWFQLCVQCEYGIFRWCSGVFISFGDVVLALNCLWGQRSVHCLGSVVRNWKYGCCGKKHSCVLCSEWRPVYRSGPHRPFGNLGRLICKHLMMKICQESCLFV